MHYTGTSKAPVLGILPIHLLRIITFVAKAKVIQPPLWRQERTLVWHVETALAT